MTREEAIQKLIFIGDEVTSESQAEAIDMAITVMRDATAKERAGVQRYIDSISTEAVQVVRCKDCKWYKKIVEKSKSGLCHYDLVARCLHDEDFCSHGERREP